MEIPDFSIWFPLGLAEYIVGSGLISKNRAGPVVLMPTALVPIPTTIP